MHPGRELTEEEQRLRRSGLRILSRMIARQMLADRAAAAATQGPEDSAQSPEPALSVELEGRG